MPLPGIPLPGGMPRPIIGGPRPNGGMPLPIIGGIPRPIIGGGMPLPMNPLPIIGGPPGPPGGGGIIGAARPLPGKLIGGAESIPRPLDWGIIAAAPGPPTPLTGPLRPLGPPAIADEGIPRPAARPIPGPPGPAEADFGLGAGGASADMEITFSPRRRTRPKLRFSSFISEDFLLFTTRYSSQSPSTIFMCLSKAMKVPTRVLVSWIDTFIFQLTYWSILPPLELMVYFDLVPLCEKDSFSLPA
mmetsp:Transcript_17400/g.27804  ORF Transcript_17400/g.27804 Transcript_17400/m.27804 type:complete len:245 (-) Transcript_17400:59-793(-)